VCGVLFNEKRTTENLVDVLLETAGAMKTFLGYHTTWFPESEFCMSITVRISTQHLNHRQRSLCANFTALLHTDTRQATVMRPTWFTLIHSPQNTTLRYVMLNSSTASSFSCHISERQICSTGTGVQERGATHTKKCDHLM